MQVQVLHGPANAAAKLILGANETVTAEAGSMIAMSGDMKVETTTYKKNQGGVMKALKRMLGGESFFVNHFSASGRGGEVFIAPTLPGDILALDKGAENLIVQSGSYLASDHAIEIDLGWQGFKALFSGESVFWIKLGGQGRVVINSFGAIYPVDVDGEYIVDSGHIVAFPESLKFTITKAGKSWMSSMLGGEGLVCKFSGKGRIWCQSHNASGFGGTLGPMLRPREA
jgi:uncharacterized protein (TIGR00266 family)